MLGECTRGWGKLAVYTLPRFGHWRAITNRATARALTAPEVERARGRPGQLWAALPGLFGTVAGPRQAEHVLCAQAELGFSPEAV
jgi:hypothetical protein